MRYAVLAVLLIGAATLAGCTEGVLDPKGPIAAAERLILFNSLGIMLAIVILSVIHVFMVFAVDPYSMTSMITGNYDPSLSPEARNARPFYHLLPRRTRTPAAPPPTEAM